VSGAGRGGRAIGDDGIAWLRAQCGKDSLTLTHKSSAAAAVPVCSFDTHQCLCACVCALGKGHHDDDEYEWVLCAKDRKQLMTVRVYPPPTRTPSTKTFRMRA
jgi:hypothetical protein